MKTWGFRKDFAAFASIVALMLSPVAVASHPADAGGAPTAIHHYSVSIEQIGRTFVSDHPFVGSYATTVTLSNGSRRTIKLVPMMHQGRFVVRLVDSGMGTGTFMGPMGGSATTINGNPTKGMVMIQLRTADYPPSAWKWEPSMKPVLKDGTVPNPATTQFVVSVYEVAGEGVFAQDFTQHFAKTVAMVDGSHRTVELTSVVHDGQPMLKLDDNGRVAWLAPDATHVDAGLMIQTRDMDPFVAFADSLGATSAK